MVVVDIPIPKYYNNLKYYEEREYFLLVKEKVKNLVEKYYDHPALLYWNLGNEIYYPYIYKSTNFFSNYNELIDLIHEIDPNHPVSTSTIGANKYRVLTIITKSPQLDFISFNAFGNLSRFSDLLSPISPIWDGPHVITEWGVNGPWESNFTSWKAPIEETSTKKAQLIKERYNNYLEPIKKNGSLGNFVFYFAHKIESTPTWYSLFKENKLKTEAVFELENIWKETNRIYKGPRLDYILLNELGANKSITLSPDEEVRAEVFLPGNFDQQLQYQWELRPESWYKSHESKVLTEIDFKKDENIVKFNVPKKEGPYRLFVYLTNETEYFATANIPFYVLNPSDEE
nr:glycoside hydrolase family 2 TIM barrel-domain containing protein [Christiangramia lutea]